MPIRMALFPSGGWVGLGILGSGTNAGTNSYNDSTSFMWACQSQVYVVRGWLQIPLREQEIKSM